MPVSIKGSGGGGVTLDAGAAASNTTLTLPNTNGTVVIANASNNVAVTGDLNVSGATTLAGNPTVAGTVVMGSSFMRNRIINGAMVIDQRNAGAALSVGSGTIAYTTDRNGLFNGGPNAVTAQRVAGPTGFQNALQITGSASNTGVSWYQRIEASNTFDLASVSVTFSAVVSSNASRTISVSVSTPNSFENFSSQTFGPSTTWEVTTTPTRFSFTFTMPANAVNGAEMSMPLGAILSGQTVTITGVQLEVGTVATPFERRLYGTEWMLCQRYCQKFNVFPENSFDSFLSYFGGSNALSSVKRLTTTMRSSPTASITNAGVEYYSYAGVWTATTLAAAIVSPEMYYIYCTSDGDGRGKLMRCGSAGVSPNPIVTFSAEL